MSERGMRNIENFFDDGTKILDRHPRQYLNAYEMEEIASNAGGDLITTLHKAYCIGVAVGMKISKKGGKR